MEKRDNNRCQRQPRMPFERNRADAMIIQKPDCGREKHEAQSKDASVHDQGKAQDRSQRESVDHVIQRLSCLAWMGGWHRCRGMRPHCQK